jgi:NAD(P)H dehydrogenase (quinone)
MRIAVTGATGRIGGEVVKLLAADGAHDIVAISRRPIATSRYEKRVRAATADYADRASLRTALRGVDTLVFVSSDGEATKVLVHHQNVITAAADSDINHIVALSGLDADLKSPFCYAITYALTEQLLLESGCSISVARASIYTEFFLPWLNQARSSGQLRLPAADGRVSFVSRSDVARALAALATAPPTGQTHEITGPEALDLPTLQVVPALERAAEIEAVTSRGCDARDRSIHVRRPPSRMLVLSLSLTPWLSRRLFRRRRLALCGVFSNGPGRARTCDLGIKSAGPRSRRVSV